MRKVIQTTGAPAAIGPYSQGVQGGNLLFTSGQLPVNPATGELVSTISEATHQCIKNLEAILEAAGTDLTQVVKVVVYLSDINNFTSMNEVYGTYFKADAPARSAFQVAALPLGAVVEIEAVALIP